MFHLHERVIYRHIDCTATVVGIESSEMTLWEDQYIILDDDGDRIYGISGCDLFSLAPKTLSLHDWVIFRSRGNAFEFAAQIARIEYRNGESLYVARTSWGQETFPLPIYRFEVIDKVA